jgi:glycosyltransferase involved in cell wall biosynthesis
MTLSNSDSQTAVVMAETSLPEGALVLNGHHYARAFARHGARMLWLSPPVSPVHAVWARGKGSARERFALWRAGGRETSVGLAYAPFTLYPCLPLPFFASGFAARHSLRCTIPNAAEWCRRRGFDRPQAFLIHNLHLAPLADLLGARRVILRIEDDLSAMPHVPAGLHSIEAEWARKADAVVCSSAPLAERARRLRGGEAGIHLLGNGCDYTLFSSGGEQPEPDDLAAIPHPRILYFGSGGPWVALELIRETALELPECSFVLIGNRLRPEDGWGRAKNIFELGSRPQSVLPAYAARCDVGIVPFRRGPIHDAADPIKVYEYMASGLAVVATRSRRFEMDAAPVLLAEETPGDFARTIREALGSSSRERERDYARRHSWVTICQKLLELALA